MKNIRSLVKTIWNASLGISLELLLVYLFIFAGFATCIIWWAVLKR